MKKYYFTSESVTEGHPDKLSDFISDSILDEYLKQDKNSRVAVETFVTGNTVVVAGQVTSNAKIEIEELVRNIIKEVGYDNENTDIDYRTCNIIEKITEQSPDIALGVDIGGAGDQGIMFGYACDETEEYMTYPIMMAHKLARKLTEVRNNKEIEYLRPDGKTQVTVEYENNKPKRIETILVSTQHLDNVSTEQIKSDITEKVIKQVIPANMIDENTKIYINPTGRFVIGGPVGDSGLTGRKIIVDTYGGIIPHGGGAFSGKDYTKVDRTAAYYARYVCKNIVASGICNRISLQVSYAIGISKPIAIYIDTFNTNKIEEDKILEIINNSHNHLNAEDVYRECKKDIPNISLGTVYRILNQLVENQLIRRLKVQEFDRFDSMHTKHSHFICTKCNGIYDIFSDIIDIDMIKVPGEVYDYDIKFIGMCNDCLKNEED